MTNLFDVIIMCLLGEGILYMIMFFLFLDQTVIRIILHQRLIQDRKIEIKSSHLGMHTFPSMLQIKPDLFQKSKN